MNVKDLSLVKGETLVPWRTYSRPTRRVTTAVSRSLVGN